MKITNINNVIKFLYKVFTVFQAMTEQFCRQAASQTLEHEYMGSKLVKRKLFGPLKKNE
jgi:hypothetical protein